MSAPYSAKSVANAFINRGMRDKISIDPLKIQKLVYYAHGYFLATSGRPLLDELFEAWPHGPVLPSLYHEFKNYGFQPIKRHAIDIDWDTEEFIPVPPPSDDPLFDKVVKFVWDRYGKLTSQELSERSHAKDGPWHQVKMKYPNLRNKDIDNEIVKTYFSSFVRKKG